MTIIRRSIPQLSKPKGCDIEPSCEKQQPQSVEEELVARPNNDVLMKESGRLNSFDNDNERVFIDYEKEMSPKATYERVWKPVDRLSRVSGITFKR